MNKTAIKNYAIWARVQLIESCKQRAYEYGITEDGNYAPNLKTVGSRILTDQESEQRNQLIDQIRQKGYAQVMEEAAYTWFNRFIALRFMEVNGYLPSKVRVFTDEAGAFKPEILKEAVTIDLESIDRSTVIELLDKQDNEELYKYLLITQCNALSDGLPYMFEKISNWTELLFPANLLRNDSVTGRMISDIPEEDWTDAVQIIGWLYQYYNSELKDETFALLKKNVKITKERIPAATQLFTPDWIVRYMVENSLGRLWYEGHKDFDKSEWKYYLDEAEQGPEVEEQLAKIREEYSKIKPEEIKVIDPCMGSGHILVYAFDVLMQIYTSAGWSERDAARSIIENNLYGLDIDDRAGQLAYFAVMMKARKYNRRIMTLGLQPNVMSIQDSSFMTNELIDFVADNDIKIRSDLRRIKEVFTDAKEFGSILNVPSLSYEAILDRISKIQVSFAGDVFQIGYRDIAVEKLIPLIKQAVIMSQKYDVVVTNPPYMGARSMGDSIAAYVKDHYTDAKADLFSCFIARGFNMSLPRGFVSMITMESWMFLSSFEDLRKKIVRSKNIVNMVHMPYLGKGGTSLGINFGTAAVIFTNKKINDYLAQYDYIPYYETDEQGIPFHFPVINERYKAASLDYFAKIPGAPIAYWVSKNFVNAFQSGICIDTISDFTGAQHKTADNEKYLRMHWEVKRQDLGKQWIYYAKGGDFRKWYGNIDLVVDWSEQAKSFYRKNTTSNMIKEKYWFKEGITYTSLTSATANGFRYLPPYGVFDIKGPSIVELREMEYCLGFFNTKIAQAYFRLLNPTITLQVKDVKNTPILIDATAHDKVVTIVKECIQAAKDDWDKVETSWDFLKHPLI